MRTVFCSSDVAHLWAHQLQSEARVSNSNFYFYGNTIFSYGSHFPCGKIVLNGNGEQAYVLNSSRYSTTTSQHQAFVRMAIPGGAIVFNSAGCRTPEKRNNVQIYYEEALRFVVIKSLEVIDYLTKQKKARLNEYYDVISQNLKEIRQWINFWGLDGSKHKWNRWYDFTDSETKYMPSVFKVLGNVNTYALMFYNLKLKADEIINSAVCFNLCNQAGFFSNSYPTGQNAVQAIQKILSAYFNTDLAESRDKQAKKIEAVRKRKIRLKEKQLMANTLKKLDEWHDHKCMKWNPPYKFEDVYGWHTALRVTDNYVETSKGIKLSFEESRRLWKLVQSFENGAKFQHELALDLNGRRWVFNDYTNHVLRAGCHLIPFSECQRIAKLMSW